MCDRTHPLGRALTTALDAPSVKFVLAGTIPLSTSPPGLLSPFPDMGVSRLSRAVWCYVTLTPARILGGAQTEEHSAPASLGAKMQEPHGSIELAELYRTSHERHAVDGCRGVNRYLETRLGRDVRISQIYGT